MDKYYEYEKNYKLKPHVVILGAGASVATIPGGDRNGRATSVMDGFLETLGMSEVISRLNLDVSSNNLEDIYSEIASKPECSQVREQLDSRIREYFNLFEIPSTPTIYDFILLALRKKDLVATFNWDPLLIQAYQRASQITSDLPSLTFLHGNVSVGYCAEHARGGIVTESCPMCGVQFTPSRLLYPITQKNYNSDPFTSSSWRQLERSLADAYLVTIFGYSAPRTDVEAIGILKKSWGNMHDRNMEDFEFIDIKDEQALIDTWKDFVHTHHYSYKNNFFESSLAKYPRRTIEELFDRTQNCIWTSPSNPFVVDMSFAQIQITLQKLMQEEEDAKGGFITLATPLPN